MSRLVEYAPHQIQSWQADMMSVPGVQRIGIEDHQFAQGDYFLFVDAVADESARGRLADYCVENIPGYQRKYGVAIVPPADWDYLNSIVDARDLMEFYLTSKHLVSPAMAGHEVWRLSKKQAFDNPNNPYRGYGSERLKVKDLSPAQTAALEILPDADPQADVYHPLDVPFMELSSDMQNRNVVPMSAACLAIADFLIDDTTTVNELDTIIKGLSERKDPAKQRLLDTVAHIAWTASDLSFGGRPWFDAQENYHAFNRLSPDVQQLDTQAMLPPVTYIRKTIAQSVSVVDTMNNALQREGGRYERWWIPEYAILSAAQPSVWQDRTVHSHDEERDGYWSFSRQGAHLYENYTARPEAAFHKVLPALAEAAMKAGNIVHDSEGYWDITTQGQGRLQALGHVQQDNMCLSTADYIAKYDELRNQYDK